MLRSSGSIELLLCGVACRNRASDQHSPTPTPSAVAADPPHRGEGMGANGLTDRQKGLNQGLEGWSG